MIKLRTRSVFDDDPYVPSVIKEITVRSSDMRQPTQKSDISYTLSQQCRWINVAFEVRTKAPHTQCMSALASGRLHRPNACQNLNCSNSPFSPNSFFTSFLSSPKESRTISYFSCRGIVGPQVKHNLRISCTWTTKLSSAECGMYRRTLPRTVLVR
jgi:hypothetical protein